MTDTAPTLERLSEIADELVDARRRRDDLIRAAHRDGISLRAIAAAAELTHPTVRKIIDAGELLGPGVTVRNAGRPIK